MSLVDRLHAEFGDAVETRIATPEDAVDQRVPQVVAAPRDEAAAQAVVAWCGREQVAFVPAGGSTKLFMGAPPAQFDLRLSTRYLTQIWDHDDGNATVEAGAGISLDELNGVVGQKRQFVPVGAQNGATLGGVVSTNWAGSSRLKYGTPRDLVTGLHAALSDGRLVKAGAKVVKNVSGYDLPKIFTGSFGTLGFLTRVTIRLRPRDVTSASWNRRFPTWDALHDAAEAIRNGPFEPTLLRAHIGPSSLALFARFDGGEEAVRVQLERLEPGTGEAPVDELPVSSWLLRATLPLRSGLSWAKAAREAGAEDVAWECGLGVVRAAFYGDFPAAAESLRSLAQQAGGFVIVERAPSEAKTPDLVWGAPRSDFPLMRRLKTAFDGANVCSPGRFVGGI